MSGIARPVFALALAGALGIAGAAGAAINSTLQIEPGQTFELGGGQKGSFAVKGRNTGPVAVEVLGKAEGARQPTLRGTIAPGSAVDARFEAGEMALLRNTSVKRMATLKLVITGDTSALGMTYSDNPAD